VIGGTTAVVVLGINCDGGSVVVGVAHGSSA